MKKITFPLVLLLAVLIMAATTFVIMKYYNPYDLNSEQDYYYEQVDYKNVYQVCRKDISESVCLSGNLNENNRHLTDIQISNLDKDQYKPGQYIDSCGIYDDAAIRILSVYEKDNQTWLQCLTEGEVVFSLDIEAELIRFIDEHTLFKAKINGEEYLCQLISIGAAAQNDKVLLTFSVYDEFANMFPGTSIEVEFVSQTKENAIAVPPSCLSKNEAGEYVVCIVDGESYYYQPIKIGINDGFFYEVLSGLKENDILIMND